MVTIDSLLKPALYPIRTPQNTSYTCAHYSQTTGCCKKV